MVVVNPQLISRDMSYGQLSNKEKTVLKKNFGRLWEVMAAGNVIPLKTQGAKTVNFEYFPADKKELSLFAGWLEDSLGVPAVFNKSTLKLVAGKTSKVTVNFKESELASVLANVNVCVNVAILLLFYNFFVNS